jgi:glycosyltransferase involved in cell wall biosynthesis
LNGWIMAEVQAQSFELQHNDYLQNAWEQERTILQRADAFSVVSTPQKYATYGELAGLGRLSREVFGKELVTVFPNVPQNKPAEQKKLPPYIRGKKVPENAFVLGQIGGFNNWLDEKSLFEGVERSMAEDSDIFFVSSGGVIAGVANSPFGRFQKRVAASRYANRFIFLGWIAAEDIPALYAESDIGIMADISCLETETGARNRLTEMLSFGLPILTTRGSEVAADIDRWECGKVVESGDSIKIKEAILELKKNVELRKTYRDNSRQICRTLLKNEVVMSPLLEWIQSTAVLTHQFRQNLSPSSFFPKIQGAFRYLHEKGFRKFWQKLRQKL